MGVLEAAGVRDSKYGAFSKCGCIDFESTISIVGSHIDDQRGIALGHDCKKAVRLGRNRSERITPDRNASFGPSSLWSRSQ